MDSFKKSSYDNDKFDIKEQICLPRPGFVPKFVRPPTISPVRQVVTCAPEDFSEQRVKKIILSRKSVVVDPPI